MDGDEEDDITNGLDADEDDTPAAVPTVSDSVGFCCGDDDGDICPEEAISDTFGSLSGDTACPQSTVSV